jgi:parvulin-like peptidyl-prolyl isomerase
VVYKFISIILASGLLASCNPRPSPIEDLPPIDDLVCDPGRTPRSPKEKPARVAVSHILCNYRGAKESLRNVKRNREEARIRAGHILKLARAKGRDFAELAKKYSDDANTSLNGGELGTFERGQLHPDLEQAAFALGIGQVSEITESPRGFHILQRQPPVEFQAAEIVITYTGARESSRYKLRTPRTREQARVLSGEIHRRLLGGASFFEEAIAHSDLFNHHVGGVFPVFKKGAHPLKLEEIVTGLGIGEVSAVIETKTGFHIVKRLPAQRIVIRQILIEFSAPGETGKVQKRTKPEALERAEEARRRALEPGSDFAALAAEYSDGPAASRGGLLEPLGRGLRPYEFEKAVFALKAGEISPAIETELAVFIVKRIL